MSAQQNAGGCLIWILISVGLFMVMKPEPPTPEEIKQNEVIKEKKRQEKSRLMKLSLDAIRSQGFICYNLDDIINSLDWNSSIRAICDGHLRSYDVIYNVHTDSVTVKPI